MTNLFKVAFSCLAIMLITTGCEKKATVLFRPPLERPELDEAGSPILKTIKEDDSAITEIVIIPTITLKGTITLLGDSMFNELVLLTEANESYVFKPEFKKQYWAEQGKVLTIRGKVEKRFYKNKKNGRALKKFWLYPDKIM